MITIHIYYNTRTYYLDFKSNSFFSSLNFFPSSKIFNDFTKLMTINFKALGFNTNKFRFKIIRAQLVRPTRIYNVQSLNRLKIISIDHFVYERLKFCKKKKS